MNPLVRAAATAAALGLTLAACGGGGDTSPPLAASPTPTVSIDKCQTVPDTTLEPAAPKNVNYAAQLKVSGVLTIGSDITFPPFESIDEASGDPVGFDVDLGKEIAKRLQLEAKFVGADFGVLTSTALPAGQYDIGISAITIKPERQQGFDFTIPYFKADLSLTVKEGSTVQTIDDLKDQVIGAEQDTTGADCAGVIKTNVGAKEVKLFPDATPAFDDLLTDRVAGVVNDLPATQAILANRTGLVVSQIINTQEVYGIAIGKQKPDLRVAINGALQEMFDDDTYAQIYRTWFNDDVPFELPPADIFD